MYIVYVDIYSIYIVYTCVFIIYVCVYVCMYIYTQYIRVSMEPYITGKGVKMAS